MPSDVSSPSESTLAWASSIAADKHKPAGGPQSALMAYVQLWVRDGAAHQAPEGLEGRKQTSREGWSSLSLQPCISLTAQASLRVRSRWSAWGIWRFDLTPRRPCEEREPAAAELSSSRCRGLVQRLGGRTGHRNPPGCACPARARKASGPWRVDRAERGEVRGGRRG